MLSGKSYGPHQQNHISKLKSRIIDRLDLGIGIIMAGILKFFLDINEVVLADQPHGAACVHAFVHCLGCDPAMEQDMVDSYPCCTPGV